MGCFHVSNLDAPNRVRKTHGSFSLTSMSNSSSTSAATVVELMSSSRSGYYWLKGHIS
jgi:hypothetical protein